MQRTTGDSDLHILRGVEAFRSSDEAMLMRTIVSHTHCVRAQKQTLDFNPQPQQQTVRVSRVKTGLSKIKTNLACDTAKWNKCETAIGNRIDTETMVGVVTKNKQTIQYLFSIASSRAKSQRSAAVRDDETSKVPEKHPTKDREEKHSVGAGRTSPYKTALNMGEIQEGEDGWQPTQYEDVAHKASKNNATKERRMGLQTQEISKTELPRDSLKAEVISSTNINYHDTGD